MVASEFGFRFSTVASAVDNVTKISIGGVMAFFMEVAEFLIVTHASSLTLSIVAVVKVNPRSGNTKRGSITVPLTSSLTGLESAI